MKGKAFQVLSFVYPRGLILLRLGESYNDEMCSKDLLLGPIFTKMWNEYKLDGFGGYFRSRRRLRF
jgi:hypothetical protein